MSGTSLPRVTLVPSWCMHSRQFHLPWRAGLVAARFCVQSAVMAAALWLIVAGPGFLEPFHAERSGADRPQASARVASLDTSSARRAEHASFKSVRARP